MTQPSPPTPGAGGWQHGDHVPRQVPLPQCAPPPPQPPRKRGQGRLGALVLLVVALGAAFLFAGVNSGSSTVLTTPTEGSPTNQVIKPSYAATPGTTAPLRVAEPVESSPPKNITAREWSTIAKDPVSHAGERVIVYGQVTQFDATTGTAGFRAVVDGVEHKPRYGFVDYETNTILAGDSALLNNVVQDDLFKAEVTVMGSMRYETTLGRTLTVPRLQVTKIDVIGHV